MIGLVAGANDGSVIPKSFCFEETWPDEALLKTVREGHKVVFLHSLHKATIIRYGRRLKSMMHVPIS